MRADPPMMRGTSGSSNENVGPAHCTSTYSLQQKELPELLHTTVLVGSDARRPVEELRS
jgi:hypothetical protein